MKIQLLLSDFVPLANTLMNKYAINVFSYPLGNYSVHDEVLMCSKQQQEATECVHAM